MQLRNTVQRYGVIARFFHWTMFLLLGLTVLLALNMEDMLEPDKSQTEWLHRSLGVLILFLLILRFGWKLINPRPANPPGPAWMNVVAQMVHWSFYFIILLQVVAGILLSQADGESVSFFGLFALPDLVPADRTMHEFWEEIHEVNWIVLTALVIGHVAAALYHHFRDRDDVFRRMWIFAD
jgi:cytochrome b561